MYIMLYYNVCYCHINRILLSSISFTVLLPLSITQLLEMAANIALSLVLLGGFLVLGITTAPVSKFTSQTVKASTFVASDTKVRLIIDSVQLSQESIKRLQFQNLSSRLYRV